MSEFNIDRQTAHLGELHEEHAGFRQGGCMPTASVGYAAAVLGVGVVTIAVASLATMGTG
ncbi:hypothetical protein ACF9IK_09260 [Kitasatospora hibisci]|uniref:hypothetical protein n=1 Tax=Kitasatospora hibisci TaxID=3369522 RepID=UPI0037545BA3